MTFLYPSAFWLLGAIFIPIIIHLLSRLKLNKVEFSTVRFIKKLESSSIRRLKIKKLLLLLLRILCITSLVMMIAQPVTKGFLPGWLAAEQDTRLILIIDNSASMSALNNKKSNLERSKNEAMSLMPLFNENTQVMVAQTCPPKILFEGKTHEPELRNSIKSIESTASYDNIWHVIHDLITNQKINEPIKECVVFSDLMYAPDSLLIKGIDNLDEWKFYFIQSPPIFNNLAILDVTSINRIKTLSQLVKLNTEVQNSGSLKRPNVALELLFNNQRVGQVISEFQPDKEKRFLFQAYPEEVGILQSKIILPKDDYALDNAWHLSIPIMKQIRCEIIGADSNDISILEMIFKAIDPDKYFLTVKSSIQPHLKRVYLNDVDVVVIHNIHGISKDGVDDLARFLDEGGGIIWFQGESDQTNFHNDLITKLSFPKAENIINAGQGFFTTKIENLESDLLNDIQIRRIDKELPEIYKYMKLNLESNHDIHWKLNNNDPLILEFSKGTGKIFYFPTLLNLRWNDFPIRAIVVPLIYRLIVLTGTDAINTAPVLVNEPKWISVEENKLMNKWEVWFPSGKVEMIVPEYDQEGIKIINTNELGFYQVYSNGEIFTSFPTRLDYNEFIKSSINQSDIEFLLPSDQTKWFTIQDKFSSIFSETRHGKSLWKIFLFLTLLFLLAESIIGRPQLKNMKDDQN